jgi:ABC-type polysaccharide/polyol phosphate transport system ATPase subunit
MEVGVRLEGVGVRFLLDRQRRPLTPVLARLRRHGSTVWGLKDVTLEFRPGEAVALVGPSGSGKTTLLRAIARVLPTDVGTLTSSGRMGYLLSTDAGLLPSLTARDNAQLLGVIGGLSRAEVRDAIQPIKRRSGLQSAFERNAAGLSAGMKARLGVATAWETDPQILLLDEVHEALDQDFRTQLSDYAASLVARGGIVIAAGQDLGLMERMCERAVLMHDGSVVADGRYGQIRNAYLDQPEV